MGTLSGVYELLIAHNYYTHQNECAIIYYRNKTWVQMFYFDTTIPLQCAALVLWKANVDRITSG